MNFRTLMSKASCAHLLAVAWLSLPSALLALSPLFAPAIATELAAAKLSATSRKEIQHLLTHLGTSTCQFNRNGRWYSALEARQHLTQKFDSLDKKDLLKSSEDFIRLAGTNSSISGKSYRLKCADNVEVESAPWLTMELARYRQRTLTSG